MFWIKSAAIAIVLLSLGFLYWRYETLVSENTELKIGYKSAISEINNIKLREAARNQSMIRMAEEFAKSRLETQKLQAKFAKHNFTKLAKKEPNKITKIIQSGTINAFREMENAANSD